MQYSEYFLLYELFLYVLQTIIPKTHREDSPSETSGETITSDSGHGGSEEDFQNSLGKFI